MPNTNLRHVVVVNDNAFVQGGAAKVAINSARGLAEKGLDVTFFAASGPADAQLTGLPNLKVVALHDHYDVKKQGTLTYMTRGAWDRDAEKRIENLLAKLDPKATVIHVHMVREQLTASVFRPMFARGFQVVMTPHEYNIGCPYGGFFNYTERRICELKGLSKSCFACRCNNGAYIRKLWFFGKGKLQQKVAHVPERLKHYIFISKFSQRKLEPYLPGDAVKHFVRNPIEATDSGCREVQADSPFVFIGRLTVEKDPITFARAAKKLGVEAVFIGDGELREQVQLEYPKSQMLGWCDRENVRAWMTKARALVFPSIWYEGAPLTVQEAESVGLPTITSHACAPSEYVIPGDTGLIFCAGDVEDLASKMSVLQDDREANRMGKNSYDRFWSDPPTQAKHVDQLIDVYEAMLR